MHKFAMAFGLTFLCHSGRRIFKVETVGDCYVAASGLPDARQDHAIAMVQFANAIVQSMSKTVRKLETSLGPDTADLSIRVGMHSGPVTAVRHFTEKL